MYTKNYNSRTTGSTIINIIILFATIWSLCTTSNYAFAINEFPTNPQHIDTDAIIGKSALDVFGLSKEQFPKNSIDTTKIYLPNYYILYLGKNINDENYSIWLRHPDYEYNIIYISLDSKLKILRTFIPPVKKHIDPILPPLNEASINPQVCFNIKAIIGKSALDVFGLSKKQFPDNSFDTTKIYLPNNYVLNIYKNLIDNNKYLIQLQHPSHQYNILSITVDSKLKILKVFTTITSQNIDAILPSLIDTLTKLQTQANTDIVDPDQSELQIHANTDTIDPTRYEKIIPAIIGTAATGISIIALLIVNVKDILSASRHPTLPL